MLVTVHLWRLGAEAYCASVVMGLKCSGNDFMYDHDFIRMSVMSSIHYRAHQLSQSADEPVEAVRCSLTLNSGNFW